jgi:hypothetical protein
MLRGSFPIGEESMKYCPMVPTTLVACCLCLFFITAPAYGYVDPNATGLISQILTPLLIVAATSLTFLRKCVKAAFTWLAKRLRGRVDG